jgi:hypothetical protein
MYCHVAWQIGTNIVKEPAVSIFRVEEYAKREKWYRYRERADRDQGHGKTNRSKENFSFPMSIQFFPCRLTLLH